MTKTIQKILPPPLTETIKLLLQFGRSAEESARMARKLRQNFSEKKLVNTLKGAELEAHLELLNRGPQRTMPAGRNAAYFAQARKASSKASKDLH